MESTGLRRRRLPHAPLNPLSEEQEIKQPPSNHQEKFDASLSEGCSDDFEKIVRSEINAAINGSLIRNAASIHAGLDSFKILEQEAAKMLESVEATVLRDRVAQGHNKLMRRRELLLYFLGLLCLICPVLVIFDKLMAFFPPNHLEILRYASQQDSFFGTVSRGCLQTLTAARVISEANKSTRSAYVSGCFAMLGALLLLVRYSTPRMAIMNKVQRQQMSTIKFMISEELQKKKQSMQEEVPRKDI